MKGQHALTIPGLQQVEVQNLTQYWEDRFPGKGRRITELIGPAYSPEFSFALRPILPGLHERCRRAAFWRTFAGIEIVAPDARVSNATMLYAFVWEMLGHAFEPHRQDGEFILGVEGNDLLVDSLEESLERPLKTKLQDDAYSFERTLHYAISFAVNGDDRKDFRPLLGLWQDGNRLLGIDGRRRLVIRCLVEK